MVFYRKYRPQNIAQLDNATVRDTLTAVLQKDPPHAFLFTGPKGLGKTSTARIVAKILNCEKRKPGSIEPCNECDQCTSITNGSNLDVLEIDAASNRGIDEIRDLREKLRLTPLSGKKKVYIIDEVHMLTTEAFNALLKTLEEPPSHVVFVLCTTESHKVPATILSRCFHVQFTLATPEELKSSFLRIVKEEKLSIDEDALAYIAHLSDGSFRDGAKTLEEIAVLSEGKKITKALVEQKYSVANISTHLESMLEFLKTKDVKSALHLVNELIMQGADMRFFIGELIGALHTQLLISYKVTTGKALGFTSEDIGKLSDLLNKAYGSVKLSVLPQLPLELAIVEWSLDSVVQPEKPAAQEISQKQAPQPPKPSQPPVVESPKPQKALDGNVFNALIDKLKEEKQHAVVGLLRSCALEEVTDTAVVISTKYSYHKERLEDKKTKGLLVQTLRTILGKDMQLTINMHT